MAIPLILSLDDYQLRQDVTRADGQPDYIGKAAPGVIATQGAWTIYKITYSGSNVSLKQVSFKAVWDNRATEDYS